MHYRPLVGLVSRHHEVEEEHDACSLRNAPKMLVLKTLNSFGPVRTPMGGGHCRRETFNEGLRRRQGN